MRPRGRLNALPAGLCLPLLVVACAGGRERTGWRAWGDLASGVRPRLEEIFLEPPVSGVAPAIESLSADGRWLLLRWSPPPAERGEQATPGKTRGEGDEAPTLRLLAVADPAATGHRGRPLAGLLPPIGGAGDASDLGPTAWSRRGARLAVARGPDVLLLHPESGRATPLLRRDVPPPAGAEADADAQGGEANADGKAFPDELRVRSVAFGPDDRTLRVADGEELYSIALPEDGREGPPDAPLEGPRLRSAGIEAPPAELEWSRDLTVVFGRDPVPLRGPDDGRDEGDEGEEGEKQADDDVERESDAEDPAQVYRLAEQRAVVLAGMAGMRWIERTSLSPDGRFVFGAELDREHEPPPTIVPDFLSERVTTREGRRLLADDGPSPARLWMWRTSSGERTAILPERTAPAGPDAAEGPDAVEGRPTGSFWLRTIGWAPQETPGAPARFAFELRSADFRERELWCWDEGACRRVWSERDEAWVGGPAGRARWHADGSRLLVGSESYAGSRDPGRAQLFAIDPQTGAVTQLTGLAGELDAFVTVAGGGVVFAGSLEDPARRVLGHLSADEVRGASPAEPELYPAPAGWNSGVHASRDGRRVVFRHERLLRPAELWTADGASAHPLTQTTPRAFEEIDWVLPERISLPSPDGRTVRAHVFLPPGTSATTSGAGRRGEPRASIVFVHGAGYLQNVTDSMTRYPLNLMFHSRLASLGYPVIDVDYRGSRGYGRDFRTDVQYHLGGKDLDDIHLVVDELARRGIVDRERVGVYGGSYGGFLALMALFTAPERWACGAALRSVTDWRTYYPGYTQPRLGRPSTHAEAYERSSPIDQVEGLEDPVLVLHGMRDANVFAQDSIRLIEALIDGGHDFEAMLYPSQGHAFAAGPHWLDEYRRIERFLVHHLGPPTATTRQHGR